MKKRVYSDAEVYKIFRALNRRKLAMFLGCIDDEPMIWLSDRTKLTRTPVSIATAEMILEEVLIRELEGPAAAVEVLVGEVLDALQVRPQRRPRRPAPLLIGGV